MGGAIRDDRGDRRPLDKQTMGTVLNGAVVVRPLLSEPLVWLCTCLLSLDTHWCPAGCGVWRAGGGLQAGWVGTARDHDNRGGSK